MNIEGIPDGWELVRIGKPFINERYISLSGKVTNCVCRPSGEAYAIVCKVEKPKKSKQYRPFANAAEFEPFRDRWVKYNGDSDCEDNNVARVVEYSDVAASINQDTDTWKDHFDNYVFDDGTPFGIEVKE